MIFSALMEHTHSPWQSSSSASGPWNHLCQVPNVPLVKLHCIPFTHLRKIDGAISLVRIGFSDQAFLTRTHCRNQPLPCVRFSYKPWWLSCDGFCQLWAWVTDLFEGKRSSSTPRKRCSLMQMALKHMKRSSTPFIRRECKWKHTEVFKLWEITIENTLTGDVGKLTFSYFTGGSINWSNAYKGTNWQCLVKLPTHVRFAAEIPLPWIYATYTCSHFKSHLSKVIYY